jgi:hypothetical protein
MNRVLELSAASLAAALALWVFGVDGGLAAGAEPSFKWANKINVSGTLDGEARWMRYSYVGPESKGAMSDLYVRMLEIGVETAFLGWASSTVVGNSEWIGDYSNAGDKTISFDEVHLDISPPGLPLYGVLGKRTQPFGLFENSMITDPMTQDAYETNKVGLTLGSLAPLDGDLSFTVYKGREQMDHFIGSGLTDSTVVRSAAGDPRQVNSFIASGAFTPAKDCLTLFGAYLNEPGRDTRNATMNLGLALTIPFYRNIVIDGEYMSALNREIYDGANRRFKETVLSVAASYRLTFRARRTRGGGSYAARKAHVRSSPFEVAARFEAFDDDSMSRMLGVWTVKTRQSLGARYNLYDDGTISCYSSLELRQTVLRVPEEQSARVKDSNTEVYCRLGLDF